MGWILLGVGALCLAVAAGIFIAVTWDTLGWLLRGAILLGVTGVFAALAEVTRVKGLRASAETLAAVAGVLWLVTLVAGTRLLPDSDWWPPLIGLAAGGAALVADRLHALRNDRLWAVDALAAVAVPILFGGLLNAAGSWHPLVSTAFTAAGVTAHLHWPTRRLLLTRGAVLVVGLSAGAALAAQGLTRIADGLLIDGWRVLAVIAALVVLVRFSRISGVRRVAAGLAGALGAGTLVAATSRVPFETGAWIHLAIAVPGVLAWLWGQGSSEPRAAARFAGIGWQVPPGLIGLGVVLLTVVRMGEGPAGERAPWWMLSTIGFVALALGAAVVRTRRTSRPLAPLDAAAVLGAWLAALILVYGSYPAAVLVLGGVLAALLVLAASTGRMVPLWCATALAAGLVSLIVADGWVPAAALGIVGVAALAWGYARRPLRLGAQTVGWLALPSAVLITDGVLASLGMAPANARIVTVVAVAGLAAVVLATHQWWWLDRPARLITESAGLFWATAAALLALALTTLPVTALCLLLFGVALVVAGQPRERRGYAWAAIGVLTLASWSLLVDYAVRPLEWYTVPTALVFIALGARSLARNPAASSWQALLPGLLFGLLPSATLAVADPVSVRALLVGVCAVSLILLGLFRSLAACFVTGAIVLAVLAVVELWPYAAYVPRWAGLAAAGVLLVAIGVRWEARLRDLRRVGGYLRGLR